MVRLPVAAIIASILAVAIGGCAGQLPVSASGAQQDQLRPVVSASGETVYVYKNASSCEPQLAVAVWGPGPAQAAPLGFRCRTNARGQG
jgi:hypothetical protein